MICNKCKKEIDEDSEDGHFILKHRVKRTVDEQWYLCSDKCLRAKGYL